MDTYVKCINLIYGEYQFFNEKFYAEFVTPSIV